MPRIITIFHRVNVMKPPGHRSEAALAAALIAQEVTFAAGHTPMGRVIAARLMGPVSLVGCLHYYYAA